MVRIPIAHRILRGSSSSSGRRRLSSAPSVPGIRPCPGGAMTPERPPSSAVPPESAFPFQFAALGSPYPETSPLWPDRKSLFSSERLSHLRLIPPQRSNFEAEARGCQSVQRLGGLQLTGEMPYQSNRRRTISCEASIPGLRRRGRASVFIHVRHLGQAKANLPLGSRSEVTI